MVVATSGIRTLAKKDRGNQGENSGKIKELTQVYLYSILSTVLSDSQLPATRLYHSGSPSQGKGD